MSNGPLRLLAGAGAGDDPVYVDDVFATTLYTGNFANQTVTNGLDLDGEGGLLWIKSRDNSGTKDDHALYDSERPLVGGAMTYIKSNSTSPASDSESPMYPGIVGGFTSTGFALGQATQGNESNVPYVSWAFRKQEKFFDIVTYTGDGSTSKTISHNLGSTPGMIIVKCTSSSYRWNVWHRDLTNATTNTNPSNAYILKLNTTDAQELTSSGGIADVNGSTFDVGGVFANNTGETFVAYLFGHNEAEYGTGSDEAIIKCGSFTGNGNDNGPEIDLGFEPQFYLFKKIGGTGSWFIYDTMRGLNVEGANEQYLNPNYDYAETSSNRIAITSTGIKVHDSNDSWNENGAKFIYMAIRRSHKPASEFAATDLFTTASARSTSAGAPPWWYSGFPVDMAFWKNWGGVGSHQLLDRLRGPKALFPNTDDAEEDRAAAKFDYQDGHYNNDGTQADYHSSMFRRAKGFFDVVAYAGNSTNGRTVTHNLGAVPEMIWVKQRGQAENWIVYNSASGNTKVLRLNSTTGQYTDTPWNDTTPTSTVFSLDNSNTVNGSGRTYISYLFASVAGISKVGSYTGTGSDLNVDCGFSAGARFILIKRTDSTGDWYLYNSNAGIVAGNDPYVLFNTTDAEVSNTDYIDPLSSGFTVTSSAPAGLNASSGTYIFLAIA